ncbi:regulation of nuclear pre-mRNA domain-containing protein 2 [Galendromus occidentalis]|uniref:Regulation of nuclear pre-mRNA domain-containing protein 2 n=1 Tax=Galendromus occidentalis TaxID=34638 RepID=A0AAJ7WK00_9ACAR|nr:regulation of nuclear pre-mRNA domain-containing protein 2 [Galendromus occidentalis]
MDEAALEKKLRAVNNTQECIETLSLWVLHHKHHSDQIASVWLRCLRKSSTKHRLALLYLCNDVLQRCRKQGRPQFLEAFKKVLQEAGVLLDQKEIRKQVDRVFSIWKQRKVYDEAFIQRIQSAESKTSFSLSKSSLIAGKVMKSPSPPPALTPPRPQASPDEELIDFEPTGLVEQVKKVRKLQLDVGAKMGVLSSTKLDISRAEVLTSCKDKQHCEQFEKDFDEGIRCLESYVAAIETSLQEHKELQTLLTDGEKYYAHQLGDVQLVANGFRTFAGRVEEVKTGLGRFRIPSPPPLPDECPSPTDSELDDMIISPERNETRTMSKETRIPSESFNPSSASFMDSDPHIFSQLKDVLRKDSRVSSEVSTKTGRDEPSSTCVRPFVSPGQQTPKEVNVSLAHQDEIKEVDMEIEDDDETMPNLAKALSAARTSNLIELTSSRDVDLRIRPPNDPTSRVTSLPHLADEDERFPPRVPFPPSNVDRPFLLGCPNDRLGLPPAAGGMSSSSSPMPKPLLSNSTGFNGISTPTLSVEELLKKIVPSINRSNLTTIVQNKEKPENDIVDPDAYDPEDNFVMDVPRVVYSPPKASSNIVEVPTSDKPSTEEALQTTSKSEISSPDGPISPSPTRVAQTPSRLLLLKKQSNDLSYLSDPRPSSSPNNQKILVEYAHRRRLLSSPAAGNAPAPDRKATTHQENFRPIQRTPSSESNHKAPDPQRDERRLYERRSSSDQRNFHSRPPRSDAERRSAPAFGSSSRGGSRGRGGEANSQQARRSGPPRHQAAGKGWGASLEGDDRVFGYQHDKIDYLSLPRPVKKAPVKIPREVRLERGQLKADGSPLKQLAATLKDTNDGGRLPASQEVHEQTSAKPRAERGVDARAGVQRAASRSLSDGSQDRADVESGSGIDKLVGAFGNASRVDEGCFEQDGLVEGNGEIITQDTIEQNVVSVEISELEEGGPADDPMLGQYFDTSSSFIVNDICEGEETPLPIIEIGETDTDLWTDATILDIDDGYGGNEDSKSIASLLEEPSVKNVPRKAASSGLRGAVVATSVGSRRSSCRDQGAFDEFF